MSKKAKKPAKRKPAKAPKSSGTLPLATRILAISMAALQVDRAQVGTRYRLQAGIKVAESFPFANLEDIMSVIQPQLAKEQIAMQWPEATIYGDEKAAVTLRLTCMRTMAKEEYTAEAGLSKEDGAENSEAAITRAKKICLVNTFNLRQVGGCEAESRPMSEPSKAAKKGFNRRSATFLKNMRAYIHKKTGGKQGKMEKVFAKLRDFYGVESPQDIPAKDDEGNKITQDHIKAVIDDFVRKVK